MNTSKVFLLLLLTSNLGFYPAELANHYTGNIPSRGNTDFTMTPDNIRTVISENIKVEGKDKDKLTSDKVNTFNMLRIILFSKKNKVDSEVLDVYHKFEGNRIIRDALKLDTKDTLALLRNYADQKKPISEYIHANTALLLLLLDEKLLLDNLDLFFKEKSSEVYKDLVNRSLMNEKIKGMVQIMDRRNEKANFNPFLQVVSSAPAPVGALEILYSPSNPTGEKNMSYLLDALFENELENKHQSGSLGADDYVGRFDKELKDILDYACTTGSDSVEVRRSFMDAIEKLTKLIRSKEDGTINFDGRVLNHWLKNGIKEFLDKRSFSQIKDHVLLLEKFFASYNGDNDSEAMKALEADKGFFELLKRVKKADEIKGHLNPSTGGIEKSSSFFGNLSSRFWSIWEGFRKLVGKFLPF